MEIVPSDLLGAHSRASTLRRLLELFYVRRKQVDQLTVSPEICRINWA